jgi:hypothetical protein
LEKGLLSNLVDSENYAITIEREGAQNLKGDDDHLGCARRRSDKLHKKGLHDIAEMYEDIAGWISMRKDQQLKQEVNNGS